MYDEVCSAYEQDIKFIIGFAGSGKSTELSKLADDKTLILTPTHKAARVLQDKGVEHVYTIHATLKLVPQLNQNYNPLKKQRMQKLQQLGTTDLADITRVFIDEYSLINTYMLDLLLEVLPAECKVTVFGDAYQLPVIEGTAIDPLQYTDNIQELTTQHRAEAPEVVETFMRFMHYIKDGSEQNLKLNPAIKKGTLQDFNPATDRALAYTNKRVLELNNTIATILDMPSDFQQGDELIANQIECLFVTAPTPRDKTEYSGAPWEDHYTPINNPQSVFPNCIAKGRLMEEDKLQSIAEKTALDIAKYNTTQWVDLYQKGFIEIADVQYSIYYDTDHYHTQKKLRAEVEKHQAYLYKTHDIPEDVKLKDWCYSNRGAKGVKERGQAWSHYIAHSNLVFNLQRPWASTVHKSQGSEYKTVYIAQDDMKKSIRNGYYGTYARLMYVSLSRAIHKVIIV